MKYFSPDYKVYYNSEVIPVSILAVMDTTENWYNSMLAEIIMTWLSKICIISLVDKIPITGVNEWAIIISWQKQVRFSSDDDDDVLLCTRPTWWVELKFYCHASSLKQQPLGRHVAPLGHIILIPSQPVFTP